METILFLLGVTAIVAACAMLALLLGWLLTEVFVPPLKFKPFNCRPCLTLWLTVLFVFALAWCVAPHFASRGLVVDRFTLVYGFTCAGALSGLINFLYIKLKNRIND